MRSSPVSKWLLSAAALLLLAAPADAQQTRIVNGTAGDRVAYQAGLVPAGGPVSDVYCGGTVRDATHVITAAHCVDFSGGDQPSDVEVVADVVDRITPEATLQRVPVAIISTHPEYNSRTDGSDAALLTLAEPLDLDAPSPSLVDALPLATLTPAFDSSAVVSGWGATNTDGSGSTRDLKWVEVKVLDDAACNLHDGYDPTIMLCAGEEAPETDDSCFGDSGGPLARGSDVDAAVDLIGIVSFGGNAAQPCGSASHPGVYTRVSAPGIRSFLLSNPVARPVNTTRPSILGTPAVGQVLTCEAGGWEGGQPIVFAREWRGTATPSSATQYTVTPADAGRALSCLVRGSNGGGTGEALSASVLVPVPPPPPPAPPPPPPPPPPALDTTRPTSLFSSRRCGARSCRLVLLARDLGGLTGATVRATVRRLGGISARRLRPVRLADGRFVIRSGRLRPGRYTFTAIVTDAVGNRQARATRVTLRIRR